MFRRSDRILFRIIICTELSFTLFVLRLHIKVQHVLLYSYSNPANQLGNRNAQLPTRVLRSKNTVTSATSQPLHPQRWALCQSAGLNWTYNDLCHGLFNEWSRVA